MIPAAALEWVKRIEGGFSDHPSDSGGATYSGLTVPALVGIDDDGDGRLDFDLDGDGDVDSEDIRALALLEDDERDAKVAAFYGRVWSDVASGLPWPASLLAFDGAVHSGNRQGLVLLQRALQVRPDGIIGSDTRRAAQMASPPELARSYFAERVEFFLALCNRRPKDRGFLHGWLNRASMLRVFAVQQFTGARA